MLSFRAVIGHVAPKSSGRRLSALRLACARSPIEAMERRVLLAMPTLWTTEGPGGGGATLSAVIAPNGQDLWCSSDMSGIYHSTDFGQSWQTVNFHNSVGGVNGGTFSKVQFTSDPNILYIASTNAGPVKSTNNGTTWTPLSGWSYGAANWVASDLSTTTKILVATGSNLYMSSNGGASFTTAYTSSSLFVGGAFFDGSNVYVGTNKGFLVSSNGGASFALAAQQPTTTNIMSFTGAKQGSTVRLFALTTSSSTWDEYSPKNLTYNGLYRLDVGGSWVNKTSAITAVAANQDPSFVSMAQNDINVVYTGGGDPNGRPQVLKSSNGGDTWIDRFYTRIWDVTPNVPNANVATGYEGQGGDVDWTFGGAAWGFSVCPADSNKAIMSECAVHVTSDGATTWHQVYQKQSDSNPIGQYTPQHKAYTSVGLAMTSVHYIEWTSPTNIMASYTDIDGWRSTDGGATWSFPTYNGVVVNTLYKTIYSGGLLYGATSNVHDLYQSTHLTDASCNPSWQTGAVVVSADQGATWSNIHSFGVPIIWIQIDPNNANRMYACAVDGVASSDSGAKGGIWVTNNLNLGTASTWTKLANPPRTQGHPYDLQVLNDGTLVATYSGRRAGSPEVFTDSSGVFVSTDGGTTWIDRSAANMHYYTMEIAIDPTDPTQNTWYVGVHDGWSGTGNNLGDLYRSTNRGVSWTKMGVPVSPGRISISIDAITINPTTKEMYLTSEGGGIRYAPDVTVAGFSAANITDVPSFPFAHTERVFTNPYNPQDVWVASFGGGIIRGGVGPGALTATAAGMTQINLTWSDNSSNETGFAIDRATDAGFTQNLVTNTAAMNATSASITGLSAGTQYFFRVRATNGPNASANSSPASATTLTNPPTGISLSSTSIAENQPAGTVVGTFSSTDLDAGDTFTYSLVSGTGSTDNGSFTISGNQLLAAASFNYEAQNSYSIRVRTTDRDGLWFEKAFTISVTDMDEIAPTVTAVYVRGSSWASGYLSFLAANTPGSSSTYGFAVPVGSGSTQLETLPWRNLDRISIRFSEDVSIAQAQFAIVGSVGSYSISGFSYSSADHVATWSLSAAIGPDKLYVAVPGSGTTPVTDPAGNILDGEWTNPSSYSQAGSTSRFPSGDGTAGGDFAYRFDVLPGDSTGGSLGKVNVADVAQTKSRSSLPVTASSYRSDFDGNNLVNVADVAYVKSKSSIYSLPANPPVLPVFGPVFSQVSLLLSPKCSLLG